MSGSDSFPLNQCRVLVVDDNAAVRDMLMTCLRAWGYEPIMVADGHMALTRLALHSVKLMITDYRMPTMDGLELLRHVRAHHRWLPVIVFSSDTAPELMRQATLLGARAWLPKTVSLSTLRETVVRALQPADQGALESNPHG